MDVFGGRASVELKSEEDKGYEGQDAREGISPHGNIIHEVKLIVIKVQT